MKATKLDLTLLDLVRVDKPKNLVPPEIMDMLPRVGKVVGFDGDTVYLDFVDFGFMLDDVSPILLTEEILKKNGFKDGQFFAELYIQGWHVISDAHNLCMECERGWHMNIPCRCLHELQHAFNLVGINMDFAV